MALLLGRKKKRETLRNFECVRVVFFIHSCIAICSFAAITIVPIYSRNKNVIFQNFITQRAYANTRSDSNPKFIEIY